MSNVVKITGDIIAGPVGPVGPRGPGNYTTTTASFTQPAASANVAVSMADTSWMAVGQYVYIATGGYYTVASVDSATQATLTNGGYSGNAAQGTVIASGVKVNAAGTQGPQGNIGPQGPDGTLLNQQSTNVSSSGGVVTIDLSQPYAIYKLTLTENVTSWVFSNTPASGYVSDLYVEVTQGSTAYTCVSPASAGRTAGTYPWVVSSTPGAVERLGLSVDSSGTVSLFAAGVFG